MRLIRAAVLCGVALLAGWLCKDMSQDTGLVVAAVGVCLVWLVIPRD